MIESFPPKLTARQQQILELIQNAIARTGAPPTRAEIATELGFKSANAAEEHLQALARKGMIELVSGTSRGIRLRSSDLQAINDQRAQQLTLPMPGLSQLMLPLIGRVAAGSPILAQEHVDQTYHVERSLFQRTPDYLLRVRGMSMRDVGILDGDLLAVQSSKDAKNGQIVVARLGDDVTVKRFMRRDHQIELHAENPDYKTIVLDSQQLPNLTRWVGAALAGGGRFVRTAHRLWQTLRVRLFRINPACVQPLSGVSHGNPHHLQDLARTAAVDRQLAAIPSVPLQDPQTAANADAAVCQGRMVGQQATKAVAASLSQRFHGRGFAPLTACNHPPEARQPTGSKRLPGHFRAHGRCLCRTGPPGRDGAPNRTRLTAQRLNRMLMAAQ
jgi:repressor LexA